MKITNVQGYHVNLFRAETVYDTLDKISNAMLLTI